MDGCGTLWNDSPRAHKPDERSSRPSRCRDARALDLSRTRITGEGLEHLRGLTDLEYLLLNGTSVTNGDLRHLHGLSNLILLTVEGTNVSESAVQEIERQLPDVIVEW